MSNLGDMFGFLGQPRDGMAMDRRTIDADGHLFVTSSVISAEAVNPYRAEDIPEYERLGLTPGKVYLLYRPAAELEKATPSFEGKPLMATHRPISAAYHSADLVIGSVTSPFWDAATGTLKASLSIWDGDAIEAIQAGTQPLSAAYRYRYLAEPGTFRGVRYDGRMVDIFCNHVAIVPDGRVLGAIVGDSALERSMPKNGIHFGPADASLKDEDGVDSRDHWSTQLFTLLNTLLGPDDMAKVEEIISNAFPAGAMDGTLRRRVVQGIASQKAEAESRFRAQFPTAGKLVHS